jgi:hypothetical protein
MVAARWRIRRMWTIETGLFNAEILTQAANPSVSEGDPDIHLSMAFRVLADDSHSLALANRYEARLQRLYDRAYKTLRELQQVRKSEPPAQHPNIQIKWVDPQEEMDMPAAAAEPAAAEPRASASGPATPTEPPASASASAPKLPNEPTTAATKEVNTAPTTPKDPTEAPAMPSAQHPTSHIQHPPSTNRLPLN